MSLRDTQRRSAKRGVFATLFRRKDERARSDRRSSVSGPASLGGIVTLLESTLADGVSDKDDPRRTTRRVSRG